MERALLDANTLLSFVTDRDPAQQEKIERLLEDALDGSVEVVLHQHALSEMVFVLKNVYRIEGRIVADLLGDLVQQPGTRISNDLDWEEVLKLWPSRMPDLGDVILASVALRYKWKIATFDKSFRKKLKQLRVGVLIL